MATVVVQAVASLDGYIARPDDLPGPIFDWYQAGAVELTFNPDHVFKVSQQSADYLDVSGVGTGMTGLPIAQHQLGFVPPGGESLAVLREGDRTLGFPTDAFTLTSLYTFSEGWLRGFGIGINGTLNYDIILYYYSDVASSGARRPFIAPNRAAANLIFSYQRKLNRRIQWKTQFNLNNIVDRRDVTVYPLITTGAPDNATYRQSPRMWVWTNSFQF